MLLYYYTSGNIGICCNEPINKKLSYVPIVNYHQLARLVQYHSHSNPGTHIYRLSRPIVLCTSYDKNMALQDWNECKTKDAIQSKLKL